MKVVLTETIYDDYTSYIAPKGEVFEVTEEEYKILKQVYDIAIVEDKESLVNKAKEILKERESRQRAWLEEAKKREEKAKQAAAKRKAKQLEKLKKELGIE